MPKKKASKLHEEEDELLEKLSINYMDDEIDQDEVMGINAALERQREQEEDQQRQKELDQQQEDLFDWQRQEEETEAANKGIAIPTALDKRDPKKDKDPLEGEDLGLSENDFLLSRKVREIDLDVHNEILQEDLLGSNIRKPRDFLSIFTRGKSTNDAPKLDMAEAIENNTLVQKELAAKQILENYHSRDNKEKYNALNIFKELGLDEDTIKEIKSNKRASEDDDLVELIKQLL